MDESIESKLQFLSDHPLPINNVRIAPTKYIGASTQLFSKINSIFDAQKNDKLDDTSSHCTQSSLRTRSSLHNQSSLNLEGNWSDDSPAVIDSSTSPTLYNDDNPGENMVTGKLP